MSKTKTHEEYVEELAIKNPNIEVLERYINRSTKIKHKCIIHVYEWMATPGNILSNKGCPECGKERLKNKHKKTHDEYVRQLAQVNPNIEVLEEYRGSQVSILHRCLVDEYEWYVRPNNILQGNKCPKCQLVKQSKLMYKSHEQYISEVEKINIYINVIGIYNGAREPILHKCKVDGYEWLARPDDILHGKGCPKCSGQWKRTHEEYVKDVKNINRCIDVIELFIDRKTKIKHKCLICDTVFETTPDNILKGSGCPKCGTEKAIKSQTRTQNEYEKAVRDINPNIEVTDLYVDSHTKIKHRCKLDGCEWYALPSNILQGRGCPQCNQSHGERSVALWLKYHNVSFQTQHTFDGCKDQRKLPFDFYLPDYNICIEYDGRQHFEPIDFAGNGNESAFSQFVITQRHDEIKNIYCQFHNIRLLRIPYFKNVDEELKIFYSFNIVTYGYTISKKILRIKQKKLQT